MNNNNAFTEAAKSISKIQQLIIEGDKLLSSIDSRNNVVETTAAQISESLLSLKKSYSSIIDEGQEKLEESTRTFDDKLKSCQNEVNRLKDIVDTMVSQQDLVINRITSSTAELEQHLIETDDSLEAIESKISTVHTNSVITLVLVVLTFLITFFGIGIGAA